MITRNTANKTYLFKSKKRSDVCARHTRGFTLIEMLVVCAIIMVLAAMALPVLQDVQEKGWRVRCLNDRKQNGLSILLYAKDYRGRLPSATAWVDANLWEGLTPSPQIHWHGATTHAGPATDWGAQQSNTHTGTAEGGIVYSLGTLARLGYAGDPELLFCPGFERSYSLHASITTDNIGGWEPAEMLDGHGTGADDWAVLSSGQLASTGLRFREYLGVAHIMHSHSSGPHPFPWGPTSPYASYNHMTLTKVARLWNSNNQVSPFLVTCNNYRSGMASYAGAFIQAGFGISHKGKGLNAVSYDGAARWISEAEVASAGYLSGTSAANYALLGTPGIWLMTNSAGKQNTGGATINTGNFIIWAKEYTGN